MEADGFASGRETRVKGSGFYGVGYLSPLLLLLSLPGYLAWEFNFPGIYLLRGDKQRGGRMVQEA